MKKLKLLFTQKSHDKGQSFMEMTIILFVLLIMLVGMVETGFLLNQYSVLTDAARAGARYGSSGKIDPYIRTVTPFILNSEFFPRIDEVIEGNDQNPGGTLKPITLDASTSTIDEVIITFYRVDNGSIQADDKFGPWMKFGNKPDIESKFSAATVQASLSPGSPDTGILVVEIFYSHPQLIKFPIIAQFIPDPIETYAYSIMPLSLAKPTPVP